MNVTLISAFSGGQSAKAFGLGLGKISPPLRSTNSGSNRTPVIAKCLATGTNAQRYDWETENMIVATLQASGAGTSRPGGMGSEPDFYILQDGVRRLTPLECEYLQGFPDGWTDCLSDSGRYRVLGNAVTVNVATWIGERIRLFWEGVVK